MAGHSWQKTWDTLRFSLQCKCPHCHKGDLFESAGDFNIRETCPACGFDLSAHDIGDGPAVFLIFILGFLLVPLALIIDAYMPMPIWLLAIVWLVVALGLTLGMLKPLKAYILALQFTHRPEDWESPK